MVYDDSRFRGDAAYRDESGFGSTGAAQTSDAGFGAGYASTGYGSSEFGSSAEYGGSSEFGQSAAATEQVAAVDSDADRDADGQGAGPDRLAVHALWEAVLLLFGASMLYLLHDAAPAALRGQALRELMIFATVVGLVALGTGASLRAAVPNLALGPVAYASAMFFAHRSEDGLTGAALTTAAVAAGIGLALALIVVGFQVPAWAASLGTAIAVMVWLQRQDETNVVEGAYQPSSHGVYWFAGFAALAVVGGLFGLIRPLRRTMGAFRPTGDPALRPGRAAATTAVLAIVGSTVLASVAGVLLALDTRPLPAGENGVALAGLALGAALLGGTSAYGRRGGVFGTVLAVALLVVLWRYGDAHRWNLSPLAIGAAAVLAGLVVTRLVESFGRQRADDLVELDDPAPSWTSTTSAPGSTGDSWTGGSPSGGWTSSLPARATDGGWNTPERWGVR